MRKHMVFTLAVATLALVGCGSSQDLETNAGSDSLAAAQPTSSVDLAAPTTTTPQVTETTAPPATVPSATGAPQGTAPVVSAPPKSPGTTAAPKAPTSTQVPQMQLSGTPQEQANQVVSATAKVAAISDFKKWSVALHQLNLSLVSYGVKVVWDPNDVGRNIYQISMGGQSACFLWTDVSSTSMDMYLQPHSCS